MIGAAKLIEEAGETLQIVGKVLEYGFDNHPDGKGHLKERLCSELADLIAAINFLILSNSADLSNKDIAYIESRASTKLNLYSQWLETGQIK